MGKSEIKTMGKALRDNSEQILNTEGTRLTLTAAMILLAVSIGTGIIFTYALFFVLSVVGLNIEDVSDPLFYSTMCASAFVFSSPFFAGMKAVVSSICRGEKPSLTYMFTAFSSISRFATSYITAFISWMRAIISIGLLAFPFFLSQIEINGKIIDPQILPLVVILILPITVPLAFLFFVSTFKLTTVSHFVWGEELGLLKAFSAMHKSIPLVFSSRCYARTAIRRVFKIFLSVVTILVLFMFHTGPYFLINTELLVRSLKQEGTNNN
jgi:hypothetical protein